MCSDLLAAQIEIVYKQVSLFVSLHVSTNTKSNDATQLYACFQFMLNSRQFQIRVGGSSLTLQVNGVAQIAATLNFVDNNAALVNGVLDVSRPTHYDKIWLL